MAPKSKATPKTKEVDALHGKTGKKPVNKKNAKTPSKNVAKTPLKTTGKTPAKSTGKTPSKSTGKTPSKSTGKTPSKSTGKTPSKGTGKTPSKSTGKTPAKSISKTPSKSTGKTPSKSTGKTPAKSRGKTPSKTASTARQNGDEISNEIPTPAMLEVMRMQEEKDRMKSASAKKPSVTPTARKSMSWLLPVLQDSDEKPAPMLTRRAEALSKTTTRRMKLFSAKKPAPL